MLHRLTRMFRAGAFVDRGLRFYDSYPFVKIFKAKDKVAMTARAVMPRSRTRDLGHSATDQLSGLPG
jgi:hypothetical protein